MTESPEEKATRLRVPLLPRGMAPGLTGTYAVCGECGVEVSRMMGYSCPENRCPAGLNPRSHDG